MRRRYVVYATRQNQMIGRSEAYFLLDSFKQVGNGNDNDLRRIYGRLLTRRSARDRAEKARYDTLIKTSDERRKQSVGISEAEAVAYDGPLLNEISMRFYSRRASK